MITASPTIDQNLRGFLLSHGGLTGIAGRGYTRFRYESRKACQFNFNGESYLKSTATFG